MGAELYEHLRSHEEEERSLLEEYQWVASQSPSTALRGLARLIIEDEQRHHRWFRELARALRSDVEFRPDDPEIPRLRNWGGSLEAQRVVERLLEREHTDRKHLRHLRRDLRDVEDTTLWGLLLTLMEMDTDKHIEILKFARGHTTKPG